MLCYLGYSLKGKTRMAEPNDSKVSLIETQQDVLIFYVNGHKVVENEPDPEVNLLQYLREKLQLCGSKRACDVGACGSCTVMLSTYNHNTKKIKHINVMACMVPLCSLHGVAVTTVEGIGNTRDGLHIVQEQLAKSHGTQCGFCSPGMVMSMYTLLHNNPHPTQQDIEIALEGNLCRCTGYRPILDAFKPFTKEYHCDGKEKCCTDVKSEGKLNIDNDKADDKTIKFKTKDPSQDPVFPSELQLNPEYSSASLMFRGPRTSWYRPTSLRHLLELKTQLPQAKLVAGFTSLGSDVKSGMVFPALLSISHVAELKEVKVTEDSVTLGAALTFSELEDVMKSIINNYPEQKTEVLNSILAAIRWFTCSQLRQVATLGGNILSGSSATFIPLLSASGAVLSIVSKDNATKKLTLNKSFYTEELKTILRSNDVLLGIEIPFTDQNEYFFQYHHSNRRAFSKPILNAGMRIKFEENSNFVKEFQICFGGIGKSVFSPEKTMILLKERKWDQTIIEDVCQSLADEFPHHSLDDRELFLLNLTQGFFFKFALYVTDKLTKKYPHLAPHLPYLDVGTADPLSRGTSHGSQVYEQVAPGQPDYDAVGRPLPHSSAYEHVTGKAQYLDDIPEYKGELHGAPVLSTKAHAKILSVDASDALSKPGVVDFITYKDVPADNKVGAIFQDEEVFATEKVICEGQIIGLIVAETATLARIAAKLVKITYEELEPILTIEQAIAANSFLPSLRPAFVVGDAATKLGQCDNKIDGEMYIGSQEHMYMEPNASLVVPNVEHEEFEIHTTTGFPLSVQETVASVLGIPCNKIFVRTKRNGGNFGGKNSRSSVILLPAVVAANKLQKPVRYALKRTEDMLITGGRNPMLAKYKIGFDKTGKIVAIHLSVFTNGGCSAEVTPDIVRYGAVYILNMSMAGDIHISMDCCKTNLPSNTGCRGFGNPQFSYFYNVWMAEIAEQLRIPTIKVMEINLPNDGDKTALNTVHTGHLMRCWNEVIQSSDFYYRYKEIGDFNQKNKLKKRGMAIMPLSYGIGALNDFFNCGAALVHIYKDGSVLVSHGGIENGQGLHIKMIQVASRALQVPVEKIHIAETNTAVVPNATITAGSMGSDNFGMAILEACEILKERLKPYVEAKPEGKWKDWVSNAYHDRVSLSSTGYYKKQLSDYDFDSHTGLTFDYFTYGAAVSEVEIDCLTGEHMLHRTDIVMDVGRSLNPAIDVGQIEGGFIQGCGLYTLEERIFSERGALLTDSPKNYKVPTFNDIPVELNVRLLKESGNPKAVYSSKGIGEPPLLLGLSVFLAIREAIVAARKDSGRKEKFTLNSPSTSQCIQLLCGFKPGK